MEMTEVPVLIMHEGQLAGQRWALESDVLTIGRAADCEVTLPERPVSRYHARVYRHGDRFMIEDLGSSNGTFVNSEKVSEAELQPGDSLRLGTTHVHMDLLGQEV